MELQKIKIGLSAHFSRDHWKKETKYLEFCVKVMEKDLQIHHMTVSSAFQNILAFLKSINQTDRPESVRIYDSILKEDPFNLNALVGLHGLTQSTKKKKEYEQRVKDIIANETQKTAVPKALMEIGLALCLLIPRYHFENENLDDSNETCKDIKFDGYENLVFKTENISLDVDLYTDTNVAQKKRVHDSVRYLKEGIVRMIDDKLEHNKKDIMVWKFFLSMAYNRLDNWISYTSGSKELRKQLSLNSLELFCEIAASFDPNNGCKFDILYFQRCLAYIGHILVSRKDVLMSFEEENYVPECFLKYDGHFIRQLWDEPKESFPRALTYGYDPIVHTRYAKYLLHDNNYDASIENIDEVFRNGDDHWYAASIRLTAYKQKHNENYRKAKRQGDFSFLTNDYLLKAEEDGKYCFETFATAVDQSNYASILLWLGTFPDGESVKDENKIESALRVLSRIYEEQGCHTHFKVHKEMAECHKNMGDLDEAIKYAIWALNSTPNTFETFPISFSHLTTFMFEKIKQDSVTQETKRCLLRQIRYYIQSEINLHCLQLIQMKLKDMPARHVMLSERLQTLLEAYDKKVLDEIKDIVTSESFSDKQLKDDVLKVIENFGRLFSIVRKLCLYYPDGVKSLLDFTIDKVAVGPLNIFVRMCLKCLGKDHKEWTQQYNRNLRKISPNTELRELDLFTSILEDYPEKKTFDFLIMHAPEDKDWVFYTFLPEMEQRPIKFEGCIPDRDFKKGETFEKNVINCLAKTRKVLLVLTSHFLKRINGLLVDGRSILKVLDEKHNNRTIDVITLFVEGIALSPEKNAVLVKFDNVDSSSYGLEWNYLRKLLCRPIQLDTARDSVKWKADADGNNLLFVPHREKDEDEYKAIAQDILPFGVPRAVYILYHPAYVIGYDGEKRIPRWVAHRIDSKVKRGSVSRKTHHKQLRNYRPDTTIPPQARSSQTDYQTRKDLTLGHMTPLADHSSTLELAKDTNILTNMVPEVKNNCLWNRLEEYCRDSLTNDFETVYVMSGTLFLPGKGEDGREFVTYEVIGKNKVAVPTDFFKVIVAKQSEEKPKIGAFIVPNKPLHDAELTDLSRSISWIEKQEGIELFRDMEDEAKKIETTTLTTPFFTKKERVCKMIRHIDNVVDLDFIWEKLSLIEKTELQEEYENKKKRLERK